MWVMRLLKLYQTRKLANIRALHDTVIVQNYHERPANTMTRIVYCEPPCGTEMKPHAKRCYFKSPKTLNSWPRGIHQLQIAIVGQTCSDLYCPSLKNSTLFKLLVAGRM